MSIHIGKIVQNLVKNQRLKAKFVAEQIHVSESSLYKIYNRPTIDIDKLIMFSKLLNTNLFLHYLEEEPLKGMFDEKTTDLQNQIGQLEQLVSQKDKRIEELEDINSSQKNVISILEKSSS